MRIFLATVALLATHVLAGTNSWTQIGPPTPASFLVADPSNASAMYLATQLPNTNTASLLKSTDRGKTWSSTSFASGGEVTLITIAPSNPLVIYAAARDANASDARLYRSGDGGATWSLGNLGLLKQVLALAIDPNDADTVYAGNGDGVFKTTNGGGVWLNVLPAANMQILATDPITSGRVYAINFGVANGGLFRTMDAGLTWEHLSYPGTSSSLAIDPAMPSMLYTALGTDVFRSTDFGSTWAPVAGRGLGPYRGTGTEVDLRVIPGSAGTLLAHQTGCGFFQSFDHGNTFLNANAGMPAQSGGLCPILFVPPLDIAISPAAPRTVFAMQFTFTAGGVPGGLYEFVSDESALSPTCYVNASPTAVPDGGSSTLSAYCSPAATTYVWSSNTGFASNASTGSVTPTQTTIYTVQGVNANGTSSIASVTVQAPSPRLANISTRAFVQTGADVVIGGFIIGGSTPKKVMVRATGPSLAAFGVTDALQDPKLEVAGVFNDDWKSASNSDEMIATGLQPTHPKEAAILMTLANNVPYTAIVSGVGGTTGTGMVEVFEVDHPEISIINISTRAKVLTGNDGVIAGFIVQGNAPKTVVINVAGPSLTAYFPAADLLANPTLTLVRSSDQAVLATNDDWILSPDAAAIQQSGFAPNNQKEPAIIATLLPGAYTAIVEGVNGGTGKAVVGVFATQ
jgi:photosystem II stability/assembly factor-like uncharacterized protein